MLIHNTSITCPFCGYVVTDGDFEDFSEHVTCNGEDMAKEHECEECEKTFFVDECVIRTWQVGKTAEEANEL